MGKLNFRGSLGRLPDPGAFAALMNTCSRMEWIVYAKLPFGGPEQVSWSFVRVTLFRTGSA